MLIELHHEGMRPDEVQVLYAHHVLGYSMASPTRSPQTTLAVQARPEFKLKNIIFIFHTPSRTGNAKAHGKRDKSAFQPGSKRVV